MKKSYDVQFLRHRLRQTEFFVILDHFLPFYPSNDPKNQNFVKMKKTPGNIITLHMYTINEDHISMVSEIWSTKSFLDRFFCHSGLFFDLLTPLMAQKIKILKKCKKHLEMISFCLLLMYHK